MSNRKNSAGKGQQGSVWRKLVAVMGIMLLVLTSMIINGGCSGQGLTDEENSQRNGQPHVPSVTVEEEGIYDSRDEVALYLHTFEKLPQNYITKREARALGWSGGGLDRYAEGKCIGGDRFGNREKRLPADRGLHYYECDIDTLGRDNRGPKRIIYSDEGDIYYTPDHYGTFTKLYDKDGAV